MGDAPLTAVIVPAAGRGERLGPGAPKALRTLAGQPILLHAVRNLATARDVDVIVVAVPEEAVEESRALLAGIELPITIVSGGDTRQDSVARALLALPPEVDVVLVHDAARPLVPAEVVDRVAAAVRGALKRSSPPWEWSTPSRRSTATASCAPRSTAPACRLCRHPRDSLATSCSALTRSLTAVMPPMTRAWSSAWA